VALHIGPAKLGSLTTARGVVQSVLSLFVGALGDRYHRGRIITAGAACQRCELAVAQLVLWCVRMQACTLRLTRSAGDRHAAVDCVLCGLWSVEHVRRGTAALLWRALLQALRPPRASAAGGAAALTSRRVPQALAFAALSGCGLALVTPCVTSVIADLWEERVRGRAFGVVLMFGSLGARPVPRAAADLRA